MNLAGVLPWTHWRAFTVIGLLAIGNLFCMACPFTFVRDLGRKNPSRPSALASSAEFEVARCWSHHRLSLGVRGV